MPEARVVASEITRHSHITAHCARSHQGNTIVNFWRCLSLTYKESLHTSIRPLKAMPPFRTNYQSSAATRRRFFVITLTAQSLEYHHQ